MPTHGLKLSTVLLQGDAIRLLATPLAHNRIAQTYLFTGTESTGKRRTALSFAAALQCLEPSEGGPMGSLEACGACLSCKRIAAGSHPDVSLITPFGAEIRIDQVRSMQDAAQLKPFMGKWRIFLLDPADRLNEFSSNSLLKILEESPPRVVFLLLATGERKLLTTILSRAVRIDFPTPSHEAARAELVRASGCSPEEAAFFYALSGGRFGESLGWVTSGGRIPSPGDTSASPPLFKQNQSDALFFEEHDEHDGNSSRIDASDARLPVLSALGLPQAQVRYLEELTRLPTRFAEPLRAAGGLEPALLRFSDTTLFRPIELLHARREFAKGLVFAPGLPRAFPLLFTRLLLDAIDGIKRDLKKLTDALIKEQKGNYSSSLLKEVEEGFGYAAGEVASGQLQGFLKGILDWSADLFHVGLTGDENLLLNKEAKDVIMSVVDRRGLAFAQNRIAAITRGMEQIRRYVNPALVLENILSDLGGNEP
ncbi:MAG: DNA polymerase III subunit [Candidatus Ozemobacteraceae bacterium]